MTDTTAQLLKPPPLPASRVTLLREGESSESENQSDTDVNQIEVIDFDFKENDVVECPLDIDETLEKLTSEYTATYNKEEAGKKWDLAFVNCLKKHYKTCVDYIIIKGETVFTIIREHFRAINSILEDDLFEIKFSETIKSLKMLRNENISRYLNFLRKLKGVQWAYYRTPPMPRLKFIIKEFERVGKFLTTNLQKIDDYFQNTGKYRIASTRLLRLNFISKYEIFKKDTRERFLYRSKRNDVVKFSCLLNNIKCDALKTGLVMCKNYGIMGTSYCYLHLQYMNLKPKPSYTTPGEMAFFAWLPKQQRTAFYLIRPVFEGPETSPRLEDYYGKDALDAPELSATDSGLQVGKDYILDHTLNAQTPSAEEINAETPVIINERPEILPLNCGTPLNYLHSLPSVSYWDNDNGQMSENIVQRSNHRRFAFVSAKVIGGKLFIFPLEDIYHGQELVLLQNNPLKPSDSDSYGQIVHSGVKRGQSSQPLTPAQISRRVWEDQQITKDDTKIYEMHELKRLVVLKRSLHGLF
jgi:hypothetical protein